MKNTIIALFSVIFVLALLSDANAQKRRDMRQNYPRMQEQLNLTDQQENKLEDLRTSHQEKMIDLRAELDKARIENKRLRRSENINRNELLNQTKKMGEIKNKMAEARTNHYMDVYESLTDEQRKIWNEQKGNRSGFREGRRNGDFGKGSRDRRKCF